MIKVLLADDHDLVRLGIAKILAEAEDIKVIAEASTGEEAIEKAKENQPDVILMNVNMPGIGGLEATKRILKRYPNINILVVTVHGDEPYPSRVLQAGATGYMTKSAKMEEMLQAVRMVSEGKRYISPEVAQALAMKHLGDKDGDLLEILSEREIQVLIMITSGQRVQDIADQLHLSPKTVNSYRYRLFEKLNVNSDVELTHLALRHNLIEAI